jgi:hypothetical protein
MTDIQQRNGKVVPTHINAISPCELKYKRSAKKN